MTTPLSICDGQSPPTRRSWRRMTTWHSCKDMAKGAKEQVYTDSALLVLDEKEKTGIRFSVWSRTDTNALGRFTDLKGNRFEIVELTVANKSTKADSLDPARLFATGDDKKDYPVDVEATLLEELEGRGLKAAGLEPDQRLDGVVVFSLPKAVKATGLLYKPKSGPEVRVPVQVRFSDRAVGRSTTCSAETARFVCRTRNSIAVVLNGGLAVLCNPKPALRGVDQHVEY